MMTISTINGGSFNENRCAFLTVPSKGIKFLSVLYSILAVTRQSWSGGMLETATSHMNWLLWEEEKKENYKPARQL